MINQLVKYFRNSKLEIRERIFRLILVIGVIVLVIGIVESFFLDTDRTTLFMLTALLLIILVSFFLTIRLQKTDIAIFIVGFVMICIAFPMVFFTCGGVEGGASVWFVLGIFYIFVMYSGKKMVVFTAAAVLVDTVAYIAAYFRPVLVHSIGSRKGVFADSLFAVLVVGIAVGILLKYEIHQYGREREVAKRQTEELAVLGKSKSQFFTNMSHEIRTPINTIIGLNEVILREDLPEDVLENAVNIQNASKMLLSLVNDILDLSQMENQKMEIIPVSYNTKTMFGELVDMVRVRIQEKELDFAVDIDGSLPSVLYGDEKRIKQVLLNLLTNAVKYTKEGSVALSVHGEIAGEKTVRLTVVVRDTGSGIRRDDLEHLFETFRRVDKKANSKIEGSGLGLSITKQLIDLMGGQITVDSIYMKGSNFTVILDQGIVDPAPIGAVNYFVHNHAGYRKHYKQSFEAPEAKILIVDDNEMNRMVAKKLLTPTKVQIDTVASGEECLKLTRKKRYQVIIMDHMMPDMDGVETLKEVRRQENGLCRKTPVIALTANVMAGSDEIYRKYGFDSYLEKPIQGERLEEEVLSYIPEEFLEYQIFRPTAPGYMGAADGAAGHFGTARRKKICITADCVCDLSQALAEERDVKMMYLYITTEQGRFQDTKEINSTNLQQYLLRANHQVTADGATVEEFEEFFSQMLTEAEDIVHISMAAKAGRSYDTAKRAAKGFDHVHIIDSGQISGGEALQVLYATELVRQGKNVAEICEALEQFRGRVRSTFVLPSSHTFYSRGYTSRLTSQICERFNLHPVLHMDQSRLKIFTFLTGNIERAWKVYIRMFFRLHGKINLRVVYVTHVGLTVRQLRIIESEIRKYAKFEDFIVENSSVSNACNCGIGTFGIAYLRK